MPPGFSFPPPPPPPPKATVPENNNSNYQSAQGQDFGSGGGRGGRGRGRGNPRGRGNFGGRGGHQQYQQGNPTNQNWQGQRSGQHGSQYGANNYVQNQHQGAGLLGDTGTQQFQPPRYQQPTGFPAGAYVNPAFGNNVYQNQAQPSYQASSNGVTGPQSQPSNAYNASNPYAGQKRKRPDGSNGVPSGSWEHNQSNHGPLPHPMKKPSAPRVPAAPAVPSFGAPLPLPSKPPPPAPSTKAESNAQKKKREFNQLGLTPAAEAADPHSESENSDDEIDGDVDEEAAFAAAGSAGPLTFELNGEVLTLESPADIQAWIEERKKLWPSSRRIEEKGREVRARMEERKRILDEARAARMGLVGVDGHAPRQKTVGVEKKSEPGDRLGKARVELEEQMRKVEELRKKVVESEEKTAAGEPPSVTDDLFRELNETVAGAAGVSDNHPSQVDATSAVLTKNEQEPDNSEAESEDARSDSGSESDSAPEEASSKTHNPIKVPPPQQERRMCRDFIATGRCKFGKRCRYQHPPPAPGMAPPKEQGKKEAEGRKTLFQRLVGQERDEEDRLAMQAIKHLGHVGFFSKMAGVTSS